MRAALSTVSTGSLSGTPRPPPLAVPSWPSAFLVALLAVLVATACRVALTPLLGPGNLRYITYFAAIVLAGAYGGTGPAVAALFGSLGAATFLFGHAPGTILPVTRADQAAAAVFLVFGGLSAALGGALRRAWLRAEASAALALAHAREAAGEAARAESRLKEFEAELSRRQAAERTTERLHRHLAHSPLAVIEWDGDLRITRWEGQAEAIFGHAEAEVRGVALPELGLVHPEDVARVAGIAVDLMSGADSIVVSRNRNIRKDGRVLHCEWYNSVVLDAGRVVSILSLVLDVTAARERELERERLLQELRRERARLRAAVENSPAALVVREGPEGAVTLQNAEASRLLELVTGSPAGFPQLADYQLRHLDGSPYATEEIPLLRSLLRGEVVRDERAVTTTVTGEARVLSFSTTPVRDADGTILGLVSGIVDVTADQRRLSALEDTERRHAAIVEALPGFTWAADTAGHPTQVSRGFEVYTGAPLAELQRTGWRPYLAPADQVAFTGAWSLALATREPLNFRCRLRRADGSFCPFAVHAVPMYDPAGGITGWAGVWLALEDSRIVYPAPGRAQPPA